MSRIGKKPLPLPQGVKASAGTGDITIEGPKGKLSLTLPPMTSVKIENGIVQVVRADAFVDVERRACYRGCQLSHTRQLTVREGACAPRTQ